MCETFTWFVSILSIDLKQTDYCQQTERRIKWFAQAAKAAAWHSWEQDWSLWSSV